MNSCGIYTASKMQLTRSQGADPRLHNWKLGSEGRAAGWITGNREQQFIIPASSPFPPLPWLSSSSSARPWMSLFYHALFSGARWHSISNRVEPKWRVKRFLLVLFVVLQVSLCVTELYNQCYCCFCCLLANCFLSLSSFAICSWEVNYCFRTGIVAY